VRGRRETGEVTIEIETNDPAAQPAFTPFGTSHRLREWLRNRPERPANHGAMYGRRVYSTEQNLTRCEPAAR
jgi:hypothetical protein